MLVVHLQMLGLILSRILFCCLFTIAVAFPCSTYIEVLQALDGSANTHTVIPLAAAVKIVAAMFVCLVVFSGGGGGGGGGDCGGLLLLLAVVGCCRL